MDIDSSTDVLLDRVAFHDEAGTSAARWLYLRRLGSFFEVRNVSTVSVRARRHFKRLHAPKYLIRYVWQEGKVVLENFHRGGDAENKNRGEVLWTCNFDGNPGTGDSTFPSP